MNRLFPLILLCACKGGVVLATDTDEIDTDIAETDADTHGDTDTECTPATAASTTVLVTDIDETLTTADTEYLRELGDSSYDPAMRPDANTLMNAWHDRGYRILYLTARGDALSALDGTAARDMTTGWLTSHGFPFADDDVFLSEGYGELGGAAADFKTGILEDLEASGLAIAYVYGNADTDVEAYKNVGIPNDKDFLVGKLAGDFDVVGIPDDEAFTSHLETWPAAAPCGD